MNRKISLHKNTLVLLLSIGVVFPLALYSLENMHGTAVPALDLAEIFNNRLVVDTNNDGIPDDIAARFLIAAKTAAADIEAAAAIAARLGFETTAMNPSLSVSTLLEAQKQDIDPLIIFSTIKPVPGPAQPCGIKIYREKDMNIIDIFGTTPQARRYAAVNFFARHPYIWDITGRETGEPWSQVKKDVLSLFPEPDRKNITIRITAVHYLYHEPPEENMNKRRQERLGLTGTLQKKGEVDAVEVETLLPPQMKNAAAYVSNLITRHKQGEDTHILNFAGLKEVRVHLLTGLTGDAPKNTPKKTETIVIPRTAVSQRFLNPTTDPSFYKKKVTITDSGSDIAGFYGPKGIYKDIDADGQPDRLVSRIIYDGSLTEGLIDLAARVGLEDCAVSLPFIIPAEDLDMKSIKDLERPVLLGAANRYTRYLGKIGKAPNPQLKTDEGIIGYSPGFNPGGLYIISGTTPRGEDAALQYAAATLPFISPGVTQPGAPVWEDLNREIELFFTRKNDAGQAAWGILQIDKQKDAYCAPDLEQAKTELYTLRHVDNLDRFITQRVQSRQTLLRGRTVPPPAPRNSATEQAPAQTSYSPDSPGSPDSTKLPLYILKTGGRLEPGGGFSDRYTPQWEVEEAREICTQKILPQLQALVETMMDAAPQAQPHNTAAPLVFIDLRLSEPREILDQQAAWLENLLLKAGIPAEKLKIQTVTAYKQGFHWIKDCVIPRLKAVKPAAINIRFAPNPLDLEKTAKYRPEPVRWLQELYPIDEILEKELSVPLAKILFIKDETLQNAVYELTALADNGAVLYKETFTPFTVEIPFQSRYREWGPVTVSSGGIRVHWQGKEIFAATIDTDPLRLWKHYQEKILPALTEMGEKQAGGPLKSEDQPFFSKLQTKVWMSEPDYRLGLDEEMVSSLESFHEDIYFNTLDYFQSLVKKDPEMEMEDPLMSQRWAAPGNIIPIIYPDGTGKGPVMETEVTGLESLAPKVEMEFQYREVKEPVKISEKIAPLKKSKPPRLAGIVVDNRGMPREAIYTLEFTNEEELSEAADMLGILEELQKENIFSKTFSYRGLSAIRFIMTAPERLQAQYVLNLKGTVPGSAGAEKVISKKITKESLDKALAGIIGPGEALELAEELGALPEIAQYTGGYSYQGRAVPVMEIGLQPGGKLVSRRKLTTYKPTVFLLGRQHANEVSSTNYAFNIAWLLARDPGYRKYLEQLNIVIEPMENPDGSALALELQEITPHHMLHAGRYSALGTDIGYNVNKADTLITEARVRKNLFERWQPDIFLNNHGYPSHEWVQQFSHYTPYQFRAYWIPRGWYYFQTGLETIGAPLHKEAGARIVKIVSEKMKGDEEIFTANQRIYDRYRRWAERWQPPIHYLELYDGTNIYKKRRGTTAPRHTPQRDITVLEAIPEAMDETAHDGWLQLAVRQGTLFITAFFDLAIETKQPIERIEEETGDVVHLQILRHRPLRVKTTE